ncbi:hypothetical protein [uncultured Wocania sp.]|uniref:hypothetical protein n=1 Tax=uncultured Wocania sp. TaxID=2834404 RepID=UPI0030FB4AF2
MGTLEQLLSILLNSLKGGELPVITSLKNTDKIIVFDTSTELVSTILKENLGLTGSGGTFNKIPVTIINDGQTVFSITSKPDNVDLVIGRVPQHQNTDYTYDNQTGILTITNTSVGNSIKTNTLFDLCGYSNSLSRKENLTIDSVNQANYTLAEKPKSINLILNRVPLSEGVDYTYDNATGLITIINQAYINQITLNSILEARKLF